MNFELVLYAGPPCVPIPTGRDTLAASHHVCVVLVSKNGVVENWTIGLMDMVLLNGNYELPQKPFPIFHYSSIPLFYRLENWNRLRALG